MIIAFILTTIIILSIVGRAKCTLHKWRRNYQSASQFYTLVIENAEIDLNFIFRKDGGVKGEGIFTHYRDSLLFYDKSFKKYFRIEVYKDKGVKLFGESDLNPAPFFYKDWQKEKIEAFINNLDLMNNQFGTKENPVRIFRVRFNSIDYFSEVYLKNIKSYREYFVKDTQYDVLSTIGYYLVFAWIFLLFKILNLICH